MSDLPELQPRIGVLRPAGAVHPVAALAEARVVRHELGRRLGPLTVDLRVAGDAVGPWAPLRHADWPSGVDAVIEPGELFGDDVPPLTVLFARTVEPPAADVRRRMLHHLGLLTGDRFDDAALADLDRMSPTPTDLWLIVTAADEVATGDRVIAGLAGTERDAADAAFDRVVDRLTASGPIAAARDRAVTRLAGEVDQLRAEVRALREELARERADQIADVDDLGARQAAGRVDGSP